MPGEAGLTPGKIETHAEETLERVGDDFESIASHLQVYISLHKSRHASHATGPDLLLTGVGLWVTPTIYRLLPPPGMR